MDLSVINLCWRIYLDLWNWCEQFRRLCIIFTRRNFVIYEDHLVLARG